MSTGHLGRPGTKQYTERYEETCPYNGIRFANEKEQSTYTCHNMDEPRKQLCEQDPHPKDCILCDFIYMKCPEKEISRNNR